MPFGACNVVNYDLASTVGDFLKLRHNGHCEGLLIIQRLVISPERLRPDCLLTRRPNRPLASFSLLRPFSSIRARGARRKGERGHSDVKAGLARLRNDWRSRRRAGDPGHFRPQRRQSQAAEKRARGAANQGRPEKGRRSGGASWPSHEIDCLLRLMTHP